MSSKKLHFETKGLDYYDRAYPRTACGAHTKRRTTSHNEVTCLQCKATDAFKKVVAGPSENTRLRAAIRKFLAVQDRWLEIAYEYTDGVPRNVPADWKEAYDDLRAVLQSSEETKGKSDG